MGKLKNNQSGFGTAETLLVVVIVAIVAFVGWYVYNSNKTASKTLSNATQVSNAANPKFAKAPVKAVSSTTAAQAGSQAKLIQTSLEAYFKVNKAYPGDLTTAPLLNTGVSGLTEASFTAPAGTKFVYKPSPSSCTTAANNCKSYTLEALDTSTGKVIVVETAKS